MLTACQIAKAVDDEVIQRDLVPSFVKLLKDNEAEVRTAIAGQIPGFCGLVERAVLLNEIMASIEDLVSDGSQHVRAALGTQISGLAPILGKQETIDHLLPMFLQMLKDEFPEVRLHIISKLELVNQGESCPASQPPEASTNFWQLSALTCCHNLSFPQLFNSPRTSSGVFAWPSLNTSRCWQANSGSSSLMRSSVHCVWDGLVTRCSLSVKPQLIISRS